MKYTALILMLAMNHARADLVTINWSLSTEREDGTPLDISEIAGTNIWFESWGPYLFPIYSTSLNIPINNYLFCVTLSTLLLDGIESDPKMLCVSNTPMEQE